MPQDSRCGKALKADRIGLARVLRSLVMALFAAACSPDTPVHSRAGSCLPGHHTSSQKSSPSKPNDVDIYADVSGSMIYYGMPNRQVGYEVTPFRNLISELVAPSSFPNPPHLYGFANGIGPISADMLNRLGQGMSPGCKLCGSSETRLDILLSRIAAEKKPAVSIIVTDLWFKNSEILDNGFVALNRPIQSIIASGRAIGVLGFKAPYQGPIYDMPRDPTTFHGKVRYRPLFVIVIADPAAVVSTKRQIERDVFVADQNVEHHFALFSPMLLKDDPAPLHLVPPTASAVMERATVLADIGLDASIPQFILNTDKVERVQAAEMDKAGRSEVTVVGLDAPIDLADRVYDGALWQGDMVVESQVWVLGDADAARQCSTGAWIPRPNAGSGIFNVIQKGSSGPTLELNAASRLMYAVAPGDTAFVRYSIRLSHLTKNASGADWFDAWSFPAGDDPRLRAQTPPMFPTLNLVNMKLLLSGALADSTQGSELAGGVVALKVE